MVLVNTKEMIQKAKAGHYAVGSFNVTDIEMIRGIVGAAEKEKSPVIIQFAELHDKYVPLDVIAPVMLNIARKATVPVAVHFDHGETFDNIVRAIRLGFTSVMVDASQDDFADNLARTKEIVKICKPLDISVEAELGPMNREGSGDKKLIMPILIKHIRTHRKPSNLLKNPVLICWQLPMVPFTASIPRSRI